MSSIKRIIFCLPGDANNTGWQMRYHDENELLHRDNAPAVIMVDGAHEYYNHGKLHRMDGPAVIRNDKSVSYYINGKRLEFAEWKAQGGHVTPGPNDDPWHNYFTEERLKSYLGGEPYLTTYMGNNVWILPSGLVHRDDKPAYYGKDQEEWWYQGYLHRIGGPALISYGKSSISKRWYHDSILHRADGPAIVVEPTHGNQQLVEWYWQGIKYPFGKWAEYANISDHQMILFKLKYGANNVEM